MLKFLSCASNQLTELDLSANTALAHLTCSDNQIGEIDLSKNLELEECYLQENLIDEVDVREHLWLDAISVDPGVTVLQDEGSEVTVDYEY